MPNTEGLLDVKDVSGGQAFSYAFNNVEYGCAGNLSGFFFDSSLQMAQCSTLSGILTFSVYGISPFTLVHQAKS